MKPPPAPAGALTLENVLRFEAVGWTSRGHKEIVVRELFDVTPTRYYQRLYALLDDPRAVTLEPVVVNRLRRVRDRRAAARLLPRVLQQTDESARRS